MLKHCGSYAAVLTNYMLHFYTKNASASIYYRSQSKNIAILHTNICWHQCPQYIQDASWFLLSLLQINISAIRPSDVMQVNEFDAIGIHMVFKLCLHNTGTQLDHTLFWGKIAYYATIMPLFKSCQLCSKFHCHNIFASLIWNADRTIVCSAT